LAEKRPAWSGTRQLVTRFESAARAPVTRA
jgi:hypothetical protein